MRALLKLTAIALALLVSLGASADAETGDHFQQVRQYARLCMGVKGDFATINDSFGAAGWIRDNARIQGKLAGEIIGTWHYRKDGQDALFTPPGGHRPANCQFNLNIKSGYDFPELVKYVSDDFDTKAVEENGHDSWDLPEGTLAIVPKDDRHLIVLFLFKQEPQ